MKYLIGMGNYAMGDDGIGLRVLEHIVDNDKDVGFEAAEIGNNGMQLLTYFEESTEKILLVDAVKYGAEPGEHLIFSSEDVETQKVAGHISTHEGDILRLFAMARDLGLYMPPIRILAVQPESMKMGDELSASLKVNFDKYIDAALNEMKS